MYLAFERNGIGKKHKLHKHIYYDQAHIHNLIAGTEEVTSTDYYSHL